MRSIFRGTKLFTSREAVKGIWYDSNRSADNVIPNLIRVRVVNGLLLLATVSLITGLGSDLPENYSVKSIAFGNRDVLKQKLQLPINGSSTLLITIGRNR